MYNIAHCTSYIFWRFPTPSPHNSTLFLFRTIICIIVKCGLYPILFTLDLWIIFSIFNWNSHYLAKLILNSDFNFLYLLWLTQAEIHFLASLFNCSQFVLLYPNITSKCLKWEILKIAKNWTHKTQPPLIFAELGSRKLSMVFELFPVLIPCSRCRGMLWFNQLPNGPE